MTLPIPTNPPTKVKAPVSPGDGWVLTVLLVIGSIATVLATLLGDRVGVSALQPWSSELLTAVSVLVLVAMTAGLALFHLAEGASVSAILERLLIAIGIIVLLWIAFGYSVTQTGGNDFIGGFSKAFLTLVTADSRAPTFTGGFTISEFSFVIFQGCVAAITAALIVGVLGKQIKLAAIVVFVPLWVTLVYFPILHMAWYWAGPDAIADAAKAVAAATDAAAKNAAQARLDEIVTDAGWLFKKGLLDYPAER
jgi:ammonium transporter, Amt family